MFLHAVQAGPASQSYGLQVAQLAGVPPLVIRAARKHLAMLEAHSVQATPQFDLFTSAVAEPIESEMAAQDSAHMQSAIEIAEALTVIDPDALSPREALDALYRLKQLADR